MKSSFEKSNFSIFALPLILLGTFAWGVEPDTSRLYAPDLHTTDLSGQVRVAILRWNDLEFHPLGDLRDGVLVWEEHALPECAKDERVSIVPCLDLKNGRAYVGHDLAPSLCGRTTDPTENDFRQMILASLTRTSLLKVARFELPAYRVCSLSLFHPDGTRATLEPLEVKLILPTNNRCGHVVGWELATTPDEQDGRYRVLAPPGRLWIERWSLEPAKKNAGPDHPRFIEVGTECDSSEEIRLAADWLGEPEKFSLKLPDQASIDIGEAKFSARVALSMSACGANWGNVALEREKYTLRGEAATLKAINALEITCSAIGRPTKLYTLCEEELTALRSGASPVILMKAFIE